MSTALRLLGYITGLIRIAWCSRPLILPALALWADVGNARTARCFRTSDRDAFCRDWWALMKAGGFVCQEEAGLSSGEWIKSQQRRVDQVAAPKQVQWPPSDQEGK